MRVLITGGAGFIGSNFTNLLLKSKAGYRVTVFDAMTYASNPKTMRSFARFKNFRFIKGDIRNPGQIAAAVKNADIVVNFAAETHVDRSILEPGIFADTNVKGVVNLLDAAKKYGIKKFIQISTDEVYGSVAKGKSKELSLIHISEPTRPY